MGWTASPSPHTEHTGKSQSRRVHVCRRISGLSQHWCQSSWLPAQIKPERLTDFSSEELKEHFSHQLFSISQLFPTDFHQSLLKIAVSPTLTRSSVSETVTHALLMPQSTLAIVFLLCHRYSDTNATEPISSGENDSRMTHEWLQPVRNYIYTSELVCFARGRNWETE